MKYASSIYFHLNSLKGCYYINYPLCPLSFLKKLPILSWQLMHLNSAQVMSYIHQSNTQGTKYYLKLTINYLDKKNREVKIVFVTFFSYLNCIICQYNGKLSKKKFQNSWHKNLHRGHVQTTWTYEGEGVAQITTTLYNSYLVKVST